MPLRAVAGVIVACIATESSAFVSLSTRTRGIVASFRPRSANPPLCMMGKQAKRKPPRVSGVDITEEVVGMEGTGSDASGGEDESVPQLVVMDLDYTLW